MESKKKLDPKIILPLVSETANKLVQLRPIEAQTGPAIRKDMVTIKKHLHLLENSDFFRFIQDFNKLNFKKY